jgi:hypothetical protein
MKVHPRQATVVSTLGAVLLAACICGAQSAQLGPASVPIGNAKPLLLEKNEGELRVRRAVSDARSQNVVSPKNNGSEHLVLITEDLPPGGSISKHKHLGQNEILLIQTGTVHVSRRRGARSPRRRTRLHPR